MRNVVESNDFMSNIINGGGNGSGCRLVMEKNEWAAGCIPAVNFVVKLVSIIQQHNNIQYAYRCRKDGE